MWYSLCDGCFNSNVYDKFIATGKKLRTIRDWQAEGKEHAKSYQTKKNIPVSTLAAMESSLLNEYFGYVEFDQDVDLKKVSVIAEQFTAFKETFFSFVDNSKASIRFRRLGNHKALGLYYPYFNCLCVEVSSPSSLIHEYGHMIDYVNDSLSCEPEFSRILKEYEKALKDAQNNSEDFNKKMNGKGKYNRSYFLKPTEVFARSFELYCIYELRIDNSLLPAKETLDFEYPQSDEYIKLITLYFNSLFNSLKEKVNMAS